jgi:thioredoxin 1
MRFVVALSCLVSLAILAVTIKTVMPTIRNSMKPADSTPTAPVRLASSSVDLGQRGPRLALASEIHGAAPRPAGKPIEVSNRQFDRLAAQRLVLVKFGAEWCEPCQNVVAELHQLAAKNSSLTVLMVDVDEERELANRFEVGAIPHLLLLRDGKQVKQWTGYRTAEQLQSIVDRVQVSDRGKLQSNPFAI